MRAVITRVLSASVTIDGVKTSEIDKGFLVLLGVRTTDTQEQAKRLPTRYADSEYLRTRMER